ncbi:MAG: SH3 domain-containing protein [Croceibacterium sp.]
MLRRWLVALTSLFAFAAAPLAWAQDRDLPYWASLRAGEVNLRVGPSENYPIDWVYHRAGLPVKVVRLYQGWRRVRDQDGAEGWIVARLLNPARTAVVTGKGLAPMRAEGDEGAALKWNLEPGVIGKLGECDEGWCKFDIGGRKGWVEQKRLWGAGNP